MSYILEALRKVEQQREQVHTHGLLSPRRYYGGTDTSMHRQLLVAAGVSGAVLSVALLIYLTADYKYFQPAQAATVPSLPATTIATGTEQIALQSERHNENRGTQEGVLPLQAARPVPVQLPESPRQIQASEAVGQNGEEGKKPPKSDAETKPAPEQKPATEPKSPPRDQRTEVAAVYKAPRKTAVKEAAAHRVTSPPPQQIAHARVASTPQPQSVKEPAAPPGEAANSVAAVHATDEELPAVLPPQLQGIASRLTIDGFVFSPDSAQRVVIINMKLYNEGQTTPDGIAVEAIHQNYVVCSYQGQRFRLLR